MNAVSEKTPFMAMRYSELHSNMKRVAEKIIPPQLKLWLLSNRLTITNEDPILNSAAARLGQAMRETSDALQRDNLEATASVINSVGGVNGDLPTEMAVSDVDDIVAVLQGNDGEYITNIVPARDAIGTSPVGDSYGCMLSTRMIPVLNNLGGFIRKFSYPNIDKTLSSEWGGINNVRFFVSSQGSISVGASLLGNDVANCFVTAREGYKIVTQAGGRARFIYLPPGLNNDPCINQNFNVHVKSEVIDLEAYELAA